MDIRTYRARSMQEALTQVRRELGPDAAVLHTREVSSRRLFGWIPGPREIEVTASRDVNVPSRLPPRPRGGPAAPQADYPPRRHASPASPAAAPLPAALQPAESPVLSQQVQGQLAHLQEMVKELCRRSHGRSAPEWPESLFRLFTTLIDADVPEDMAREMVERIRGEVRGAEISDLMLLKARVARMIESEITVTGPIAVQPGRRRLVALVGPTGVGKTTTIAKLAANYRLKEKRRVGLVTVDTYRIAAVEQLRTYADIIDLPMVVVSAPREMRQVVERFHDLDLILMDTAGRSPKDELKLQELKAFLSEAGADEVHLVLSSAAGSRTLQQMAEQFAAVGTTALILTKLDEAASYGNLLPVLRSARLPLSYLTNGQNVPDDIETADPRRVTQLLLGTAEGSGG